MKKIKVVQYGVTHEHAPGKIATLQKMQNVFEVVGVVDDRCSTSPRFPKTVNMSIFEPFPIITKEEFFNRDDIEAVFIEVTNADLVETASECLSKGIAMHLDKPGGEDAAAFDKLVNECETKNIPLQMGYMLRGNPAMEFCVDTVRKGLLGDIYEVQADMHHHYGNDEYKEYLKSFKGGIMYNLCCHFMDFITRFMGAPEDVHSVLKSTPDYPEGSYNNCVAILEYKHATATLRSCSRDYGMGRRMRIAGTKGTIDMSPTESSSQPLKLTLTLNAQSGDFPAGQHELTFPLQRDRYMPQFLELAAIVRGDMPNTNYYAHDRLVNHINLACAKIADWKDLKNLR